MTLKEKIDFLLAYGFSQARIEEATGITQSSISKILNGQQDDVFYSKGRKLDGLVRQAQSSQNQGFQE